MEKSKRGFASLDAYRRREIASAGGKAATDRHKWDSASGAEAGRIGGLRSAAARKAKKDARTQDGPG